MKRYWVSWVQHSDDYRPLTDPPTKNVLGWWCSGYDSNGHATLCAVIEAAKESDVFTYIHKNWEGSPTDIGPTRFCREMPRYWRPNDRFPITRAWEMERFGIV